MTVFSHVPGQRRWATEKAINGAIAIVTMYFRWCSRGRGLEISCSKTETLARSLVPNDSGDGAGLSRRQASEYANRRGDHSAERAVASSIFDKNPRTTS